MVLSPPSVLRMFELLMNHSIDHFMLCCKLNKFCSSRAQICLLTSAWRNYFLYRKLFQEVLEVCTEQQKHLERQCLWSHYYLFYFIFCCLAPAHILYIFGVYSTEMYHRRTSVHYPKHSDQYHKYYYATTLSLFPCIVRLVIFQMMEESLSYNIVYYIHILLSF